jgi:hypothetical protein
MASVLFTALALIAAGQADLPAAPGQAGKVQNLRAVASAAPAPSQRTKRRYHG